MEINIWPLIRAKFSQHASGFTLLADFINPNRRPEYTNI